MAADRPVRILAPRPNELVSAGGVSVEGRATPGSFVRVRAQCKAPACSFTVVAGPGGKWRGRVKLMPMRSADRVKITAAYSSGGRYPAATRSLRLHAEGPAARAGKPPGDARSGAPQDRQAPPAAPEPRGPGRFTMVGDSLAEGTENLLPRALAGWQVTTDARRGRTLAEGMAGIAAAAIPPGSVLGVSLFTNDSPANVGTLERAVRQSAAAAGRGGCVVWATISRPPVAGRSYEAANSRLRSLDGSEIAGAAVVIVDWAALVERTPALLGGDRVHATPAGYQARAELYARGARSC